MKRIITLLLCATICYSLSAQNEIVESSNEFSFEIFQKINNDATEESNLFLSPFSIYDALAMAYDGAAKKTATEIRKVMKFKKKQTESHKDFVNLLNDYAKDNSVFTISNAAVAQKDYNFLESYLADLKDFNANLSLADFSDEKARNEAVNNINNWVNKNTNGKISDLLTKNDVTSLTKLILLNAIYFNAKWETEFRADKTRQMTFYGNDSVEYVTDFMNGTQRIALADDNEATAVRMNYAENKASMFIIMPKENVDFNEFVSKFTNEKFNGYTSEFKEVKAELSMPKFKIESRYDLKEILMDMGIKLAFSKSADFSKMNGKSNLLIDNIIHKSFLDVTESGTEAAAATAVIVREKTAFMNNQRISINRPFIFVIKENKNDAVLFVGKYVKPENSK